MAVSKEDVIANLRAIIISSKGGLKLSEVRNDYVETFGVDVPLKGLGCNSLEEFFKVNSENFSIIGNRVQAVTKVSSLHIVSLVNRQQNSRRRGRSKLSSKQARNLRKPQRSNDTSAFLHSKKISSNVPSKFTRQNSNKDNLTSALKQLQQIQHAAVSKRSTINTPLKPSPNLDRTQSEKNYESLSQFKAAEGLKGITRTVVNDYVSNTKDSIPFSDINKNIRFDQEAIPFKDFEDLNISMKPQSRLLKMKSLHVKKSADAVETEFQNPDFGSPPASPFRRSLANNTQEEIMSAKKSAQNRLDNNKNKKTDGSRGYVDLVADLEDDTKYEHKLKQFCMEKGLIMPVYSVIVREPKNQPKCYGCKLSIGDTFQVSTYPVETHSEITARELASKKAFNQLSTNSNLPASVFETEHVLKLRGLCSKKNLPEPIFKSIECHPKNEPKYFICKVRIGEDVLLSSYPEEVKDERSARDLAAKKAYNYLFSDTQVNAGVSKSESEILTQIYNIIKTKEYGVWSNKVPGLYLETYKENLQPNWFDLVEKSSNFEISVVERAGSIIRAKNETEVDDEIEECPVLATLKVPESNQWEVYITNVVSSAEIWCRLIGKDYSEVYDTMMTKIELQPPTAHVKKPIIGEIYLVNIEESWNRVRVTKIFSEKEEASVFLIDIGAEEVVGFSQLFYLQKSFFSVAPQALLLSLNELDCLLECEELQPALFHCLLGSTFIAEVVAILDDGASVSSVNLWDTSTEEDVNVNLKLLDDVIKTIKSPGLPTVGLVREMYVSHIDDNGDVFLQTSKQNAQYVDSIISIKMKNSGKLASVKKLDSKKLYVTQSNKNGQYYRAKLSNSLDSNSAVVKFIDYGYEQPVTLDNLFDLEETSLDLATIPSQVIRVKLSGLKVFNNKVLGKIREYILEQSVLVKVSQMLPGTIPSVELFKRSSVDGTLSAINNKIIEDKELMVADSPTRKKSFVIGLENTLSKNLPMPNIPPIGSYFNVFVTLAAHPGLFSVQPLVTQNELIELMFRLQEKYEGTCTKPLAHDEFKIGELYAVKHADDFWYRAHAHAIISPSTFTVCLCDFGDFIIVPAEKLRPLSSEFKTFPYQSIRAYLAGIAPVNKDWSPVDCVNFRELVIEKQFVSQVVEINRDLKNPNYISLGLILMDTSTEEDIYIHKLLIERKMAVLKQ